jgi:hypothetical protein
MRLDETRSNLKDKTRLFKQICAHVGPNDVVLLVEHDFQKFTEAAVECETRTLERHCDLELSFRMVFALPNASIMGFDASTFFSICVSRAAPPTVAK